MRPVRISIVVIGVGLASIAVLLPFLVVAAFIPAPRQNMPEEMEAKEHFTHAVKLEQAGDLDGAIAQHRLAHQDGLYPMTTRRVAGLLQAAGRYEEALAEIDGEGPAVSWGEYCNLRTRCLEAWKGPDAAVAWLLEQDREDPTRPFFQCQIGMFHYYGGRPWEAIAPLLEAERRALARQKLHWNDKDELTDDDTTPHDVNDLCDLWPTLEVLCKSYEAAGDDANAWLYATREVSLHQRIKRLNGYFGERWQAAGSFDGRMVRARVLLRRRALDAAAVELSNAEEVMSSYPPHQQELSVARAELARQRGH